MQPIKRLSHLIIHAYSKRHTTLSGGYEAPPIISGLRRIRTCDLYRVKVAL